MKLRSLAVALIEHVGGGPAEQPAAAAPIVPDARARKAAALLWAVLSHAPDGLARPRLGRRLESHPSPRRATKGICPPCRDSRAARPPGATTGYAVTVEGQDVEGQRSLVVTAPGTRRPLSLQRGQFMPLSLQGGRNSLPAPVEAPETGVTEDASAGCRSVPIAAWGGWLDDASKGAPMFTGRRCEGAGPSAIAEYAPRECSPPQSDFGRRRGDHAQRRCAGAYGGGRPVNARPTSTSAKPQFPSDDQGYLNSAARCDGGQTPLMFGRTSRSLVAVCVGPDGQLEYRGVRLSDEAGLTMAASRSADGAIVATNDDVTYSDHPAGPTGVGGRQRALPRHLGGVQEAALRRGLDERFDKALRQAHRRRPRRASSTLTTTRPDRQHHHGDAETDWLTLPATIVGCLPRVVSHRRRWRTAHPHRGRRTRRQNGPPPDHRDAVLAGNRALGRSHPPGWS